MSSTTGGAGDERAAELANLVGDEIADTLYSPEIHARLAFRTGATLDLYRMPEISHRTEGARAEVNLDSALAGLVGHRVVTAGIDDNGIVLETAEGSRIRVQLGGDLADVASYDVAVLDSADPDATISVWVVGE